MKQYLRMSRMKKTIRARDEDQPKTLSPLLTKVRKLSQAILLRSSYDSFMKLQSFSKSIEVILTKKQQRVEEIKAFLQPVSPQLKASDVEQPKEGDLTIKERKIADEIKKDYIRIEKVEKPVQIELKSKLYERRTRK